MTPKSQRTGIIYVVLMVMGYSFFPVFTKTLLARGVEPFDIAFWRYLFTVPVFWLLVVARRQRRSVPTMQRQPLPRFRLLLIGTLFAGEALTALFGLDRIPAGTFVVLFYSYPAIVAILEAIMGERLSRQAWLALGLTLVGIALTAPDFSAGFNGDNLPGVLLALADAFMVAIYFIVTSRLIRGDVDNVQSSAWTVSGALIVLVLVALVRGVGVPTGETWLYLGGMTLVSTILPIFMMNAGLQKLGATRTAIIATFEPLLTIVLAMIFVGEVMQPIQWVGGAVIIASVILLQIRRSDRLPVAEAIGDEYRPSLRDLRARIDS